MLCSIGGKTFGSHNSRSEISTLTNKGNTTDTSGVLQNTATLSNCGKPLKLESYGNQQHYSIMDVKVCNQCQEQKRIDEYPRNKNKKGEIIFKHTCKKCYCANQKQRRMNNIEAYQERDKQYYQTNKEVINKRHREYLNKNAEIFSEKRKENYQKNADKVRLYNQQHKQERNEMLKHKRQTDPLFRMKESLKVRIFDILKSSKQDSSSSLIGCTSAELKQWIEYNFRDNQCWGNYGAQWHIDHVVPISHFDLTDETQRKHCFHWLNLRPLDKKENISKSNKIYKDYILTHADAIKSYVETHSGYQAIFEKSWWQRLELWYGNNPQGSDDSFKDHLKWAIRSQDPNAVNDEAMDKVQRLNVSGSEVSNQHL